MKSRQQIEDTLDVISQAWGPRANKGYCFFSWIDRQEQSEGKKGFHDGPPFEWPTERNDIVDHMLAHQNDDLYWCPVIFGAPHRRAADAHEEYSLWADLDEADPHRIDEQWRPTVAWETSPGRYQALWLLNDPETEDLYGAARQTGENRLMTHMVKADPSGWDITQLLRVPGWNNHKPEYNVAGRRAQGKLLWHDGPRYDAVDFNRLPSLPKGFHVVEFDDELMAEIEDVDRAELAKRIGPLLPRRAQNLLKARSVNGDDRSKTLWYLVQCLAETECTVAEIIAMVRPTVWNKFDGRADELRRLGSDAAAAVDAHDEKSAGGPLPTKRGWAAGMADVKRPSWLIPGVMTQGSVGFIAGEPKTRKSWVGLDLAFSVAMSGDGHAVRFLNHFDILDGGPVLYMILEDALPVVKSRGERIWSAKRETAWTLAFEEGQLQYGRDYLGSTPDPSVDYVGDCLVQLSSVRSQEWLSTMIGEGKLGTGRPYRMLIVDTLMRSAGDVDENKSLELMNKLLGPLTLLSRRHRLNIVVIHHFKKQSTNGPTRGGQRMLGSQALHAWAEDSIYVTADAADLVFDVESKSAESSTHRFSFTGSTGVWLPTHTTATDSTPKTLDFAGVEQPRPGPKPSNRAIAALAELGPEPQTVQAVADHLGVTYNAAKTQLERSHSRGLAHRTGTLWYLPPITQATRALTALTALGPGGHTHQAIAHQAADTYTQTRRALESALAHGKLTFDPNLKLWSLK